MTTLTLFEGANLWRLLQGLGVSFGIALLCIACSIFIGLIVGVMMSARFWVLRALCKVYLESVRIIPILALLYVCYFGLPQLLDISISNVFVAVLVFSIWGGVEMADLVRGALSGIHQHQKDAAFSLGLGWLQVQAFVVLPLASKRLIPGLINLFTRMIKTTSLLLFIGIADILQVGRQIIEANRQLESAPFVIYGVILLAYFAMCYPLSRLSRALERRWDSELKG